MRRAALVLYVAALLGALALISLGVFAFGWSNSQLGVANAGIAILVLAGLPLSREKVLSLATGSFFASFSLNRFADASHGGKAQAFSIASLIALAAAGAGIAISLTRSTSRSKSRST
jgi:hypothetical protein